VNANHRSYAVVALAAALAAGGLGAGLLGCKPGPQPKPLSQLTPAEADGHGAYMQHCAVCHYDRVDEPLHGPSLSGIFKKQYLPSGAPANDDRVAATIHHGRGNMPPQPNLQVRS
jgi:mono/diheme cytochrome c family protein